MSEPTIDINGKRLTQAEAMTLRVAASTFLADLQEGLGDDEIGFHLTTGYKACLNRIFKLMMEE